jgi:hypothetical protein
MREVKFEESRVNLSDGEVKQYMELFKNVYHILKINEFNENNIRIISDLNCSFDKTPYSADFNSFDSSFCSQASFLWMWIGFLVSLCPYFSEVSDQLEECLNEVAGVIKRNRGLFVWFILYVLKGENLLKFSLSDISNKLSSSTFLNTVTPTLYSKCLSKVDRKEFTTVLSFLVNNLMADFDFSNKLEMTVGTYCFIKIYKNPPSFGIDGFGDNFTKQLQRSSYGYDNFLNLICSPNEIIHESCMLRMERLGFEVICKCF